MLIATEKLFKQYGETPLLRDCSLHTRWYPSSARPDIPLDILPARGDKCAFPFATAYGIIAAKNVAIILRRAKLGDDRDSVGRAHAVLTKINTYKKEGSFGR